MLLLFFLCQLDLTHPLFLTTNTQGDSLLSQAEGTMPAPQAATMPAATTADASSEPSSLLSIVDRTAYDRLIKSIADDLPQATQQKFRGKEEVMTMMMVGELDTLG